MFSSNRKPIWLEKLQDGITEYVDERFDDYKHIIARDLSKGLASLAGMITVWSILIVGLVFTSFTIAFSLGWILSFWVPEASYLFSFALVSILLIAWIYYIIKNKRPQIEKHVFKIVFASLSEDDKKRTDHRTNSKHHDTRKEDASFNDIKEDEV